MREWSIRKETGQVEAAQEIWDELPDIFFRNADQDLVDNMNRRTILSANDYFFSPERNEVLARLFTGKAKGPRFEVSLPENLTIRYLPED